MAPTFVSLSRVAIAPFIVLSAISYNWPAAFVLFMVGLATDWLDGWFATKLNVKSRVGQEVDTYCDFVLSCGAVGGLVLVGDVSWSVAIGLAATAIMVYLASLIPPGEGFITRRQKVIKRFCDAFLPSFSIGVIIITAAVYAVKAFGGNAVWLLPPAAAVVFFLVKTKRHRLRAWFQGG